MADGDAMSASALNVGLLLFIPYRAMEARVFGALAEAGFDDVTPAQARVMQRIGPGGTRLTELAEAAQVTKQTAGFLVDQLERAGYVRRTPDPTDARARLVRIAERGAAAQPVAAAVVAEVEAEWRAHLGDRRWEQLRVALSRLREITDPYR
jgi:DNA-binding MarR family transcriptional regulator